MVDKKKKVSNKNNPKTKSSRSQTKDLAFYKKLAEENLQGWQRAKADYQNLVRRQAQESENHAKFANEQLVLEILPLLDNFNHALNHLPSELADNNWVKGVMFIKNQLENILESQGVKAIECDGQEFDPAKHEAVAKEKAKDPKKKNRILEVLQTGYMMKDKVIRAARVKVAV